MVLTGTEEDVVDFSLGVTFEEGALLSLSKLIMLSLMEGRPRPVELLERMDEDCRNPFILMMTDMSDSENDKSNRSMRYRRVGKR